MEETTQNIGDNKVASHPLTPAQMHWRHHGEDKARDSGHTLTTLFTLNGVLDMAALQRSLGEMTGRHHILRSVYQLTDDGPRGLIMEDAPDLLRIEDLRGQIARVREENYFKIKKREMTRSFDLSQGPLIRVTLICLGQGNWVILSAMHPIIMDRWSVNLFFRELSEIYNAFSMGEASPLKPLPLQFGDHAWEQHRKLSNDELGAQWSYWLDRLKLPVLPLDLPVDRPRDAKRDYQPIEYGLALPEGLNNDLRRFCKAGEHEPFCVLLTAFKILLYRHGGQSDILVGAHFPGRNDSRLQDLIGPFLNTLILRTQLIPEGHAVPNFRELLCRVETMVAEARGNSTIPFEALAAEGVIDKSPFQVFFDMSQWPAPDLGFKDVEISLSETHDIEYECEIRLFIEDSGHGFTCRLVYDASLFHRARITEFMAQYKLLLKRILQDPLRLISDYSLLTRKAAIMLPKPVRVLDPEWRGAFHQQFEAQVKKEPGRLALATNSDSMSYGVLDLLANRLARRLTRAGLRKGHVVGIYAHRSAALVTAVFGAAKAGCIFVLFDAALPLVRLKKRAALTQPKAWLIEATTGPPPDEVLQGSGYEPLCRLRLPQMPDVDFLSDVSGEPAGVLIEPNDVAYLAFSVCPNGVERVVEGLHSAPSHFSDWVRNTFRFNKNDRSAMLSGLSHHSLMRDIITPLAVGGSLYIPNESNLSAARLAHWLAEHGITSVNLTPGMSRILASGATNLKLLSLRQVFYMGETLVQDDLEQLHALAPGARVVHFYGATETQQALSWYPAPEPPKKDQTRCKGLLSSQIPLGKGITDVQLLVLNHHMEMAGIGEVGMLYMRSPHLAQGYLGEDEEGRFIMNPFTQREDDRLFRMGDLGRYLLDGNVARVEQAAEQLNVGGLLVDSGDIETPLVHHGLVRQALVTGISYLTDDGNEDTAPVACIIPKNFETTEKASLIRTLADYARATLPPPMRPASWLILDHFPLTPCLRVDRQALRMMATNSSEAGKSQAPRRNGAPTMGAYVPRVLNERLDPAAPGEQALLFLGGSGLPRCYLNNPRRTALQLLPDPCGKEPGARMLATHKKVCQLPDGEWLFES